MIPVDIEIVEVGRGRPVFQHVHEHSILTIVGHVVGHDVLNPAHIMASNFLDQRFEFFDRTELRI